MINYLEDYQLQEVKDSVGYSFYYNGPKYYMVRVMSVGKTHTEVEGITRKNGLSGKRFDLPNRLIYNMIG